MFKKIAVDIGHNDSFDGGAVSDFGNENNLNMEVGTRLIEKLKANGIEVLCVTPKGSTSQGNSLFRRVVAANAFNADLYVSIHHNTGGGTGVEVFAIVEAAKQVAARICENIAALGYKNRGVKSGSGLYVVKNPKAPSLLVECCFLDNQADIQRENFDDMAESICKGILGEDYKAASPTPEAPKPKVDSKTVELQAALNRFKLSDPLDTDGVYGNLTTLAVRKFQRVVGLLEDGIAGTNTWNAINQIIAKPLLKVGTSYNYAVKYVQYRVGTTNDGVFGSGTRRAVMIYQTGAGLASDGVVGEKTWKCLIG